MENSGLDRNEVGLSGETRNIEVRKRRANRPLPEKAVAALKRAFGSEHYPSFEEKEKLAQEEGITVEQVIGWLNNERQREKKRKLNPPQKKAPMEVATEGKVGVRKRRANRPLPEKAVAALKRAFGSEHYPSFEEKEKLAQEEGITVEQVIGWLNNERQREKKRKLNPPQKNAPMEVATEGKMGVRQRRANRPLPEKAVAALKRTFGSEHYPSFEEKEKLAQEEGITVEQVIGWLNNERQREKKRKLNPPQKKAPMEVATEGKVGVRKRRANRPLPEKAVAALKQLSAVSITRPLRRKKNWRRKRG